MASLRFVHVVCLATLAACGSSGSSQRASQAADPNAPFGPDAYCQKTCIDADHDRCMAFASRFSDAFLAAYDACGDVPACIQPKIEAAPRTERQEKLAADFCAKCTDGPGCVDAFYAKDGLGTTLVQLSDARLDAVETKCLAAVKASDGGIGSELCKVDFESCVVPFLEEDARASAVCRARR